ncbi:MAG TPA: PD-(D/E)XK nuclease family protein [Caldilineaceae bacterium]|nr:PD-(D/E)XK nuclease family protein [Caldilineaceae bacterium]
MELDRSTQPARAALLPDDFSFSQSSLQAFADCARRFWLAYVQRLPWPAIEAEPVQDHELLMRLGAQFHLLVQRAEIGLDLGLLTRSLPAPLDAWFAAYQSYRPSDLPSGRIEVERVLTVPLALSAPTEGDITAPGRVYRLAAKYDLIAADEEGRVVIVDWKTGRRRPEPSTLRQRLQTLVYLYVLVEAAPALGWGEIAPEQVEMRYWFTAAPNQPIIIRYDQAQHAENGRKLKALVQRILAGSAIEDFPLAPDTEANRARLCRYCAYRSRCNRGVLPGHVDDLEELEYIEEHSPDSISLHFSLDDVAEIAF